MTIGDAQDRRPVSTPPAVRRLMFGTAAVLLADLIVGMTVFSTMVLGTLLYFSLAWMSLAREAEARGLLFGTPAQFAMAEGAAIVTAALLPLVVYLGIRAVSLSRSVWSRGSRVSVLTPGVGWLTLGRPGTSNVRSPRLGRRGES